MNVITISGRLTKKPELKQTSTNKYVCDFSIAVNRGTKNEDGDYEVDFINCRCWNKTAENLCKYQNMGDFILVVGRLQNDHYTNKNGENRHITYVQVENIEFVPKAKPNGEKREEKQDINDKWEQAKDMKFEDEDLPFMYE